MPKRGGVYKNEGEDEKYLKGKKLLCEKKNHLYKRYKQNQHFSNFEIYTQAIYPKLPFQTCDYEHKHY